MPEIGVRVGSPPGLRRADLPRWLDDCAFSGSERWNRRSRNAADHPRSWLRPSRARLGSERWLASSATQPPLPTAGSPGNWAWASRVPSAPTCTPRDQIARAGNSDSRTDPVGQPWISVRFRNSGTGYGQIVWLETWPSRRKPVSSLIPARGSSFGRWNWRAQSGMRQALPSGGSLPTWVWASQRLFAVTSLVADSIDLLRINKQRPDPVRTPVRTFFAYAAIACGQKSPAPHRGGTRIRSDLIVRTN